MSTSPASASDFESAAPLDSLATVVVDSGAIVSGASYGAAASSLPPVAVETATKQSDVDSTTAAAASLELVTTKAADAPLASPVSDKYAYLANRAFDIPTIDVSCC